ncbi:response regulator [Aequorivita todarodis]|uniref:response regulator n=1 Tax=Aequorivita todarodis TaxID=2036821 RepID=UPI0023508B7B|nr:response regulator [Aequorivita todarodis]
MPFLESQKVRLANLYTLLSVFTALHYLFFFIGKPFYGFGIALSFVFLFPLCWLFNHLGYPKLARGWLYVLSVLFLFWLASSLGKDAGIQLILVLVLVSGILMFELEEKGALVLLIVLGTSAFVGLELTDYSLFPQTFSKGQLHYFHFVNIFITLLGSIVLGVFYASRLSRHLKRERLAVEEAAEIEDTIHYFSNSLFGKNTVDEILWDVTKNCIGRLGFVDCVIYLIDEKKQVLVQKAAYGTKNPREFEIFKPIDIPIGAGIVGHVAQTAIPEIVADTSRDPRYIADDANRLSEIAVPLVFRGKVLGVIDSEHPQKGFYTARHLGVLKTISSICANKIAAAQAEEEKEKALKMRIQSEKIKAFDELKTKLFANISHELRTPLTLINSTVEKYSAAERNADWHLVKQQTDRLLRLINQILDLTKLESGYFGLNKRPDYIFRALRAQVSIFSSMAASKQITINSQMPSEDVQVLFDADALEKIVSNLLSNAIKFSDENTAIHLAASYTDGMLHVSIKDHGKGISAEDIGNIFDRYYQGEGAPITGTGIGLSLTKELVELHGGTISAENNPGKGSTFTFTMRMERATEREDAANDSGKSKSSISKIPPPSNEKNKVGAKSVLLVEDQAELAEIITEKLDPFYNVQYAMDGKVALEIAKKSLPDLIISDVMMPGIDGLELCRILKETETTSHIPVVLLTARADMETKLKGLKTGADDYITKPFHTEELLLRLSNLLEQKERLKKRYLEISGQDVSEIVITGPEEVFMKKLIQAVEDNLEDNQFTVAQLCAEVGTSRMQLHRKLNALTGKGTTAFIRHRRLLRAAKLLASGLDVSQAAYSVGFSSLSYFSKCFKKYYGVLPSEYSSR